MPLGAGAGVLLLGGQLQAPGALLSGVALLAGGFLAAFGQISSLRLRLTDRADTYPDAERMNRDALDETATHLLMASYTSALAALTLVLGMNFGSTAGGAVCGVWAALSTVFCTYVLLIFLIAVPRLYGAYLTINAVRRQMSGAHRE